MSISRREPGSRLAFVVLICSAALLAPLAWPLVAGRVFVFNDLSWFHLPLRYLYQQALQAGDTVLWTPSIFAGFYVHGEGQIGAFHPLHQLLYRSFAARGRLQPRAARQLCGGVCRHGLVPSPPRSSAAAALFGAMLFAFSGFTLLHHHHLNMVAVVAHLPWLLARRRRADRGGTGAARRLGFAALALILGSAFLLGFPQAVWWDAVALAAFARLRAADTRRWRRLLTARRRGRDRRAARRHPVLPSADAVAHSDRAACDGASSR